MTGSHQRTVGRHRLQVQRRPLLIASLSAVAAVFLVMPAGAGALGLQNLQAAPANPQAGANSDFHLQIGFTAASDQVRDLTIHLPPGLVGNPNATPLCAAADFESDSCAAASQVGTVSTDINVHVPLLSPVTVPLTVSGQVYNVVPQAGEPARFGIALNALPFGVSLAPNLLLPPIHIQAPVQLRQSDFGLDNVITKIPNTATLSDTLPLPPANIDITQMTVDLLGSVGGRGFLRNPTSCGTKTTSFEADSYAHTGTFVTGDASYTSTGCDKLPFHPALGAHLGAPGQTGPGTKTPATTVISQDESEAGLKRAQVDIPPKIGTDTSLFNTTCAPALFQAGSCPAGSIIGDASATSPLLTQGLTGPVALVGTPGSGIPQVGLDLRGPLALKLLGSVNGAPPGIVFDGLPDIPISTFALHFNPGLLIATTDLCVPPAPSFHSDFTGHNGAHTMGDSQAVIDGCGNKGEPTLRLKLSKKRSTHPKLKLKAAAGINKISKLNLKIPKPLKFARGKRFKRGARVIGDGAKLPRSDVKHAKRALTVLSGNGSQALATRVVKGALRRTGRYRKSKLTFPAKIADASGHTASFKFKVRVRH
jgi:hypothetical protein